MNAAAKEKRTEHGEAAARLDAIRALHEQGAVTTDRGRVIYASIHGHVMHELLYGELCKRNE